MSDQRPASGEEHRAFARGRHRRRPSWRSLLVPLRVRMWGAAPAAHRGPAPAVGWPAAEPDAEVRLAGGAGAADQG